MAKRTKKTAPMSASAAAKTFSPSEVLDLVDDLLALKGCPPPNAESQVAYAMERMARHYFNTCYRNGRIPSTLEVASKIASQHIEGLERDKENALKLKEWVFCP